MKHTQAKIEIRYLHCPILVTKTDTPFNVADVNMAPSGNDETQANAKRLKKCWNSHDDLLAACKRAKRYISNGIELGYIRSPDIKTDPAHETLPAIEAAIEQAESEK